jgi:hypothetical protein
MQTTVVDRGPSPDLYNASPRRPKAVDFVNEQGQGYADAQKPRKEPDAQEEKIYYDKDNPSGLDEEEEEEIGPGTMSATSYPGQECKLPYHYLSQEHKLTGNERESICWSH